MDPAKLKRIHERYSQRAIETDLTKHFKIPVLVTEGKKIFFSPVDSAAAAKFRGQNKGTRIFSAATDLGVQANKGLFQPGINLGLNQIQELYTIKKTGARVSIGAKVNLTRLEKFAAGCVPELEKFLRIFASVQIKNIATLAGNVVNGSPIGDTLPFLHITDAVIELRGSKGPRKVAFHKFYKGYRQADVKADEIVTCIHFDIPSPEEVVRLFKVSQRKDLDISCVNAGFRMRLKNGKIEQIRIAYGGVGPTVLSLPKTEAFLLGKTLDAATVEQTVKSIAKEITPRSDVRGSRDFRLALSQSLFKKFAAESANA